VQSEEALIEKRYYSSQNKPDAEQQHAQILSEFHCLPPSEAWCYTSKASMQLVESFLPFWI